MGSSPWRRPSEDLPCGLDMTRVCEIATVVAVCRHRVSEEAAAAPRLSPDEHLGLRCGQGWEGE